MRFLAFRPIYDDDNYDDDDDDDKAPGLRPHPRLLDTQEREDEAVCQHSHHKQAVLTINIPLSIIYSRRSPESKTINLVSM